MNFNDDPLADLLSDNSLDNDNFFDAPGGGGLKKPAKLAKPKGKLEDLFGIQEETEADVQGQGSGARTKPNATSTPRIVIASGQAQDNRQAGPRSRREGGPAGPGTNAFGAGSHRPG